VRAPRNHRSINSLFIERVAAAEGYFSVVSYEKLVGETIEDALLTEALFRPWGTLISQLHRLSSGYLPKTQQYAWYESDFLNVERYIPTDHDIRSNAQRIIQDVGELPSSQFQYGLIHADVYQENMFLVDGELLLFDFDNCECGHYISDIAIALYAALWRVPNEAERAEFSERFLRSLFAVPGRAPAFPQRNRRFATLPPAPRSADLYGGQENARPEQSDSDSSPFAGAKINRLWI
jgi:amicoumacin kinase